MEREEKIYNKNKQGIRKHLIDSAKREDNYKEILRNLLEKKKKEEILTFDESHPSRKYRTVWENLGISEEGELVTYKKTRILVPRKARKSIIMLAHNEHLGRVGVALKICKKFYWPQLMTDVQEYLADCKDCKFEANEVD